MASDGGRGGAGAAKSFRWRSEVEMKAKGRAETHTYRQGKTVLAVVRRHRSGGWFWYTTPDFPAACNTSHRPVSDLGAAMDAAGRHCRAALAGRGERGGSDAEG